MGTSQSSQRKTKSKDNDNPELVSNVRGLKTVENHSEQSVEILELVDEVSFPSDEATLTTDEEEETSEEEEEEDEDEEMMERLRVLEDARKLKQLAQAFLYPECPVVTTDPCASARCYFDRASAVEEEEEERARILEDALKLKEQATVYAHPELPVTTTDPTACARCYFDRASAADAEEEEERACILEEAAALKKLAVDYAHPELPVVTTDPTACGRNYFDRASAPDQEMEEERARILEEAAALKKLAVDYAHPEVSVTTTDSTACGRNYFGRASGPDQEEDDGEFDAILEDMLALKQAAADYLHPELPVESTDATACGRNYYGRASALEQESLEEAEERARIMEEANTLKKVAYVYHHPEEPIVADSTAFGRNYFDRASAPELESVEDTEERLRILEEMQALKKVATDYLHPEVPVVTTDSTATGRNYFDRASAPDEEMEEERARILEEMQALKDLAVDYAHPELPVVTTDPTACARCYFERATAIEQESAEDTEERLLILEEMQALKKLAVDFTHPELPVITTDSTACARCYFDRASAVVDEEMEDERARILEEAAALKKFAVDYAHPEAPVVTTDSIACGRNYFDRASANAHRFISTTAGDPFAHEDEEHEHDHAFGHFEFDEDEDIYSNLSHHLHDSLVGHFSKPVEHHVSKGGDEEEEEGKLSRSPSSVMLFGAGACYEGVPPPPY